MFNWKPSTQIIPFPGDKRIGKARHVTQLFISKSEKAQHHYWQSTANRYIDGLTTIGVSEAEAEKSLDAFREAVQREIDLIPIQDQRNTQ